MLCARVHKRKALTRPLPRCLAVVPPGYFLHADSLVKCPSNANGTGYFRAGWVVPSAAQDADPSGVNACTPCGTGIPSRPSEPDERPDLGESDGSEGFGLVAATASKSCYIEAGWGMTFDPTDFTKFVAIAPCPANTYGVAATTYGLQMAPCKSCSKNLGAPAGSTSFKDCTNRAGFGYASEGSNQCELQESSCMLCWRPCM